MHPWGYLERQRADGFFRRVETMIPGIDLPEWAKHSRRAPNFDFESIAKTFESYRNVYEEATPSPHYNTPNYFALQHFGNQRFFMGYWSQRLFFNEKPLGNYFTNVGRQTKEDLELMDNWYGSCRFNTNERLKLMSSDEKERYFSQTAKWRKHIDTYFPEFRDINPEPSNHKYDEPNYERNMDDIRDSIFANKCMEIFSSGAFTQDEIQAIYEFFIGGHEYGSKFFNKSDDDGYYHGTELYHKFNKEFNLPDIFKIQKVSAKTPEQTYLDRLDRNWNINYNTVDTYRRIYSKLNAGFSKGDFPKSVSGRCSDVRNLITEEVYNSMFRSEVKKAFSVEGNLGEGSSIVLAALKKEGNDSTFEQLYKIQEETRSAFPIANRQVRNQFLSKIREYLKSRPYDPAL